MDVDYGELMDTKATIVRDSPVLEELVKPREVSRDNLVIESEHYYGVGCDLRDLRSLDMGLRPLEGLDNALVLCVAEVSVTYMEPNAADALISWAKTLSSGKMWSRSLHQAMLMRSRCHLCPAGAVPTGWCRSPVCEDDAETF